MLYSVLKRKIITCLLHVYYYIITWHVIEGPGFDSRSTINLFKLKYLLIEKIYKSSSKANEKRIIVNGGRPLRCACASDSDLMRMCIP